MTNSLRFHVLFSIAGKVDDLKIKYPALVTQIDELNNADPSPSKKYLQWMVKQINDGARIEDIIPSIQYFNSNTQKFDKKDIHQYSSVKELEDSVKAISEKLSKTQQKNVAKGDAKKIYEDDEYVVVRPDSKDACVVYGKNTKWCITMKDMSYYEQYTMSNVVFYFILRKSSKDNFDKIALAYQRDENNQTMRIDMFDAEDNVIDLSDIFDQIGDDRGQKIIALTNADAVTVPKSELVKIKDGTASEEEFLKYWNVLDEEGKESFITILNKKYLPLLVKDPSRNLRWEVSQRIDPEHIHLMMNDENSVIRKVVAQYIDERYLSQMINDEDVSVRREVSDRIDPQYLPQMMNDKSEIIRANVARRADPKILLQMMNDPSEHVVNNAVARVDVDALPKYMNKPQLTYIIAARIDIGYLPEMLEKVELKLNDQNRSSIDHRDAYDTLKVILKRIDPEYLIKYKDSDDALLRERAAQRIDPKYLPEMLKNEQTGSNRLDYYSKYVIETIRNRLRGTEREEHIQAQSSRKIKLRKLAQKPNPELGYSYIMRILRKGDMDRQLKFQKVFKQIFDDAMDAELEHPENIALMAAMKAIDFKDK